MAKKKNEKDVLIVRDEKTGEISVVAGLQADGTPRRTPPKMENARDFLQFDKNGDVLDNFFRNFFRQCKEPSRFGFYRIAADQAENLLGVMKELLKDPVANADLLAPHKVDTSAYEKLVAQEQKAQEEQKKEQNQTNNVEPQKQENMEPTYEAGAEAKSRLDYAQQEGGSRQATKQQENVQQNAPENKQENKQRQGYQPIDESRIDWQALEKNWGVKREELEQSGDLQKMLNYGKSDLVRVTPNFGGESFSLDARLSFRKDDDGNVRLVPHFIRKEQKLDEYKGHKFTPEEKKALKETGNLGRIVDLVDKATGEITPSFISIDRKTNEITDMPAARIRIPERIGKTEITPQEREMLRAGLPVKDKLIERNDGRKFVTTLQVNVEQRGVEFVPGTGKSPRTVEEQSNKESPKVAQETPQQDPGKQRRNTWTNEDGSIRPITKWKGVPFTEEQKADYVAGKTVKLENVPDDKGVPSTMYLRFNPEKGRPYRYDTNPDNAQKVAPANESRTQVAVNSQGKTNEATKNVNEPLQKGQTTPKDDVQQKQEKRKSKGMKV